jgi:hypothetical protein
MAKNTPWPKESWPPNPPMMFHADAAAAKRKASVMMLSH